MTDRQTDQLTNQRTDKESPNLISLACCVGQGMESQFSMVLMEAAMKIASFTDASIFLLIDTPEGRSWVGRKNLKEEFINGRMQIRPNDVEYDVNPK